MLPILLIHGYSSEGKNNTPESIYGTLPAELRKRFGDANIHGLNLSRWISLNDGIALDDVSFAMDRALKARFPKLLNDGFNVVIHSTGALVVRNWIRLYSPKPCPIQNLVHLAGANFGSGLAHIGRGQLARWSRALQGTGRGVKVLNELEFGSWKTIDLHRHFLEEDQDMYQDYQVQEFCLIGSQTLKMLRQVPIRYVKEDSSDNTVRTSAGNLNFNYIAIRPKKDAYALTANKLAALVEQRLGNEILDTSAYDFDLSDIAAARPEVPYCVLFETAHFGDDIGIVTGSDNREEVLPLLCRALETPYNRNAYADTAKLFASAMESTFYRAQKLKWSVLEWNKQAQYEGHAQIVFRVRDQFGEGVENFDITFKSKPSRRSMNCLERMIEDKHTNGRHPGTITFYLRTQSYDKGKKRWIDLLQNAATVRFEVTAHEDKSEDIDFAPVSVKLTPKQLQSVVQSFRTTIIDVTMLRIPSSKVFAVKKST